MSYIAKVSNLSQLKSDKRHATEPPTGGPHSAGCPWLLIQHIRTYRPYLETPSSTSNLSTRDDLMSFHKVSTQAKRKFPLCTVIKLQSIKTYGGVDMFHAFLNSIPVGGERPASRPGYFTH
jgi:hypothetical protein